MNGIWEKFKGLKTWVKVVVIIVLLTIIGSIFNATTKTSKNVSHSSESNVTTSRFNSSSSNDISKIRNDNISTDYTSKKSEFSDVEKAPDVSIESSVESVPHRTGKEFIGVSDKSFEKDNIYVLFTDFVRNDTTGKWKLARLSREINISEYILDYYRTYFKNDNEVHFIINIAAWTTTRINVLGGTAFVTVLEHVVNEENDAKELGGGAVLHQYTVYLDNGDIESYDNEEKTEDSSKLESSFQSSIQEKTVKGFTFIVNTDSKVFHTYECQAVKKMNSENRKELTVMAYSQLDAQWEMEAKGYDLCGICGR